MDYNALIRDLRSSAKALRENSVYSSDGDPVRLIVQADEAGKAADAIADLRARNDALVNALIILSTMNGFGGPDADCKMADFARESVAANKEK